MGPDENLYPTEEALDALRRHASDESGDPTVTRACELVITEYDCFSSIAATTDEAKRRLNELRQQGKLEPTDHFDAETELRVSTNYVQLSADELERTAVVEEVCVFDDDESGPVLGDNYYASADAIADLWAWAQQRQGEHRNGARLALWELERYGNLTFEPPMAIRRLAGRPARRFWRWRR